MVIHARSVSVHITVNEAQLKELHPAVWLWFPPLMWLTVIAVHYFAPELTKSMLALDHHNRAGLVENATVAVLLPGIAAGIVTVWRHHHTLAGGWSRLWIALWTLGALYFGLEEISWGQWIFGWNSPDLFVELNEQQETNLHNMSAWLNRRPRVLLEWWILVVGLAVPMWRLAKRRDAYSPSNWRFWIIPTHVVLVTAALYLIVRIARWLDHPTFGNTELREYYIAVFISVYLLSCWARARSDPGQGMVP